MPPPRHGGGARLRSSLLGIADSNPHYFRRVAEENTALMEIGILRNDGIALLSKPWWRILNCVLGGVWVQAN